MQSEKMGAGTQVGAESGPPLSVGACATLACQWEATAAKPGNVYRGADFAGLTYVDFLTSAAVIGPCLERALEWGVGRTVLAAVRATQGVVRTNTNLGTILLLAPLAAVPPGQPLTQGLKKVIDQLDETDTGDVFAAIRLARPGGLGQVDQADVREPAPPALKLLEAMRLAAERDSVGRQYVNGFEQVFTTAERLIGAATSGLPLGEAIVYAFLQLLGELPDSLIARKCGRDRAMSVTARAAKIVDHLEPGDDAYQTAIGELDFYLRSDGHRLNPGTSADIVAAALFVLLREQRLEWPVRFYWEPV
jgi:triphosphoribosyl-dephospho-CoA synthase